MPVIKSAIKKLRQDLKRTHSNQRIAQSYKAAIQSAKKKPTKQSLTQAQSMIDKAAKRKIIHKNKAARLKKQVARHA